MYGYCPSILVSHPRSLRFDNLLCITFFCLTVRNKDLRISTLLKFYSIRKLICYSPDMTNWYSFQIFQNLMNHLKKSPNERPIHSLLTIFEATFIDNVSHSIYKRICAFSIDIQKLQNLQLKIHFHCEYPLLAKPICR